MKYTSCLSLISLLASTLLFADKNPPLNVNVDARSIAKIADMPLVSYADVLEKATPSVVAIYTSQIVSARQSLTLPEFYRQFSRPIPRAMPEEGLNRERKERLGVGSGVIISADGYIVTNYHVVQGMRGREVDEILVRLNDGTEYVATLIGSDSKTDVAILKIEVNASLPAVTLADSDLLRVGDIVFAIGNPRDLGLTATQGIVSALERNRGGQILGAGSYENFIQTDAAIKPGNSGGPLLNAEGEVIGINTLVRSGPGAGLGFAIPINRARSIAKQLVNTGRASHPVIGVGLAAGPLGPVIRSVQPGAPAASAGLKPDDVITAINGVATASPTQVVAAIERNGVGRKLTLSIKRGETTLTVSLTPMDLAA